MFDVASPFSPSPRTYGVRSSSPPPTLSPRWLPSTHAMDGACWPLRTRYPTRDPTRGWGDTLSTRGAPCSRRALAASPPAQVFCDAASPAPYTRQLCCLAARVCVCSHCLVALGDKLVDGLDEVLAALDDGLLHGRRVGHWGIVHAEALDGRIEEVEALLGDHGGDGGADAA